MSSRSFTALLLLFALLGVGLRFAGARGELWVDEIWSVEIAREVSSPLELTSKARIDNNHLLNTAYLQLLADSRDSLSLRAASLLAGAATLAVVAWIGLVRGRADALVGVLLFGVSYPFVLYGSEARGYAQAVFFALLAYGVLLRHLVRPRPWSAAVFSVCGVLGPLAHLTYVHVTLGCLLWSSIVWLRSRGEARILLELVRCHAAPLACVALLYLGFVRDMTIAGGPDYSFGYAVARATALLLGLPAGTEWLVPALVIASIATLAGLVWLAGRWPSETLGLALLGVVSPALVILATRPELIYPRYFLVSLAFVLLIWTRILAGMLTGGGALRWSAGCAVCILTAGHLIHDVGLARHGRSQFAAELGFAGARPTTQAASIAVGSDPISQAMLRFYAPALPRGGADLATWGSLPERGVEWLVLPDLEGLPTPPSERQDRHGNRYRLVGVRPVARESGFATLVYRADSALR